MFSSSFSYSPGDSINGFKIISVIGKGGFGEVYQIQDVSGARFALKILLRSTEAELSGIAKVRSLNDLSGFIGIHSAGQLPDGRVFYLMPRADNLSSDDDVYIPATLANRLSRSGRLPTAELLDIVLAILSACSELHRHHLIHGDIKPENIIFLNNQAKLSDFSLLRNTTPPDGNGVPGTPGFLPQEELFGGLNGSSPQLDLYAVGMLLYTTFNLRPAADYPAPGDGIDLGEYRILRKLYGKALSPSPAFRYRSAEDFICAVRKAKIKVESEKSPWFFQYRKLIYTLLGGLLASIISVGVFHAIQLINQRFATTPSGESIDLDTINLAVFNDAFSQLEIELEDLKTLRELCEKRHLFEADDENYIFLVDRISDLQKLKELHDRIKSLSTITNGERTAAERKIKRWLVTHGDILTSAMPDAAVRRFQQLMTPENFFTPAELAFYRQIATTRSIPVNQLHASVKELILAKMKIEQLSDFGNIREYQKAVDDFRRLIPKN